MKSVFDLCMYLICVGAGLCCTDIRVASYTTYCIHSILAQLAIDNRVGKCRALIKFLQLALIETANNGPSPLQLGVALTAPLGDRKLIRHHNQIIHRDFPVLDANLPRIQQKQIANRLGELVEDACVH